MGQPLLTNLRFRVMLTLLAASLLLPATAQSAATRGRLPVLVSDTSVQIQLAYRLHPAERERRQEQLAAAVAAWRAAPRSDANNERLAAWLHAAIRSSMPGSREALPPAPTFASSESGEPQTHSVIRAAESPAARDDESNTDPFRDDPISE